MRREEPTVFNTRVEELKSDHLVVHRELVAFFTLSHAEACIFEDLDPP